MFYGVDLDVNITLNIATAICMLLAGVGVLLMGCKVLSENMERLANTKIKGLFNKTSKSKLAGVGIGAATTALVQSSGVTTVMIVGFVNAGMITLYQATTLIMGANIGTTVVAQIASLQGFSIAPFAMALAGLGMLTCVFIKKEKIKVIGSIFTGLGLIFIGLSLMTWSMQGFSKSQMVVDALSVIKNPFLLLLIGILFTALLNSSAAVTSIIISMAAAGLAIGGDSKGNYALFVILGSNIGSCVTALMSSLGASTNAKRTSMIHLMFNVFGSMIFFILLICWKDFNSATFAKWFTHETNQIAMFHTFFNVICTIIFLPLTGMFVKLSMLIVKGKDSEGELEVQTYLDKRFLANPAIALEAVEKESMNMLDNAIISLEQALKGFNESTEEYNEEIRERNNLISVKAKSITDYLVEVSTVVNNVRQEHMVSAMHSNISDILRVSELSDNLMKYISREIREGLIFSNIVKEQLATMMDTIKELTEITKKIILKKQMYLISAADEIEDRIDKMRKDLINGHIERLNKGECKSESSSVFINLVGNLERSGDHINYVAHSIEGI